MPRARIEPVETPVVGGTRGGAKDASLAVKAQAVILFYKKVAAGAGKMAAYAFASEEADQFSARSRSAGACRFRIGFCAASGIREK